MGVFSSCKLLLCSDRDRLLPIHYRRKIPGMSGNSLEEKTHDEELIWILPEAVMTFIRHGRLWCLSQPLNEPDQRCRSSTLVLNMSSVNRVFLCLLPHVCGSPLRSQCVSNVRRDVSQKALRDLGKGGAAGRSGAPRHTQLMLPGLTVLDACSAPWELSCFYWRDSFWAWTKQIILAMHYLHPGKQPGHTSVYDCIHC